jgi:four helix bundle protein
MSERQNESPQIQLPHHSLRVYREALEFLAAVRAAKIRDSKLRDQAMRAAKSAALNIAEAAGRVSPADKSRVSAIARGEAIEAICAVEIATIAGDCDERALERCAPLANALYAMLTPLSMKR